MNLTSSDLRSFVVHNSNNREHDHVEPKSDYLFTHGSQMISLQRNVNNASSTTSHSQQQSSDEDLNFYPNPANNHPVSVSSSHIVHYERSDNNNGSKSFYELGSPTVCESTSSSQNIVSMSNNTYSQLPVPHHHHLHQSNPTFKESSHTHSHSHNHHHHHHHHHHAGNIVARTHSQHSDNQHSIINHIKVTTTASSNANPGSHNNSGSTGTCVESSPPPFFNHHQNNHHHHNRHNHHHSRKRKSPVSPTVDSDFDDDSETCSSRKTLTPSDDNSKKQNHSEIEKRRRDKMNTYITELSGMVPMCSAMSRKLDKLTVLRMAVQHMKTLRGSRINSYTEGHYKPSFVSDEELKHLILQSAEGFLFVVGCDRGRLLYVSESVSQVLNFSQGDLLGQSWFDILHPKDVAKVKEQLSSSDLSPRERLIDAKTMLPVKGSVPQKANRLCPGARRSFFCRMKFKLPLQVKEEIDVTPNCHRKKKSSTPERKYIVIHCTGYLKSWAKIGMEENEGEQEDPCNLSCLVAVGRILAPISLNSPHKCRPVSFISRHAIDGKFVFVDQRATLILGFLPQELLGTSMYEYCHPDDIAGLVESHKIALTSNNSVNTHIYRFRTRDSCYVKLNSTWKAFRNPWTKDTEYIISKNTLIRWVGEGDKGSNIEGRGEEFNSSELDFFDTNDDDRSTGTEIEGRDIQHLINTQVPYRNIGEQIADEILDSHQRTDSSSCSSPVSAANLNCNGDLSVLSPTPEQGQHGILASSTGISSPTVTQSQMCLRPSQPSTMSPAASMVCGTAVTSSGVVSNKFNTNGPCIPQPSTSRDRDAMPPNTINVIQRAPASNISNTMTSASNNKKQLMTRSTDNDPMVSSTIASSSTGDNNQLLTSTTAFADTEEEIMVCITDDSVLPESPIHTSSSDGNDEAAMAVIMSLLEADAGLGGPVDFSGLPWPLP